MGVDPQADAAMSGSVFIGTVAAILHGGSFTPALFRTLVSLTHSCERINGMRCASALTQLCNAFPEIAVNALRVK